MDADLRLVWVENRIQHSLKVKIDEIKSVFKNDHQMRKLRYFLNVAHCQQLFVYHNKDYQLTLATESPSVFKGKGILFCKLTSIKLTMENIEREISTIDLNENIIEFSETIMRDVFLPLVCANQNETGKNLSPQDHNEINQNFSDKMLDIVHRLIANLQIADGFSKDQVVLFQPNLDVLQDVLSYDKRKTIVLHVLETTVINWCKQIKIILMRETILKRQNDEQNTPLIEIGLWQSHLETVVNVQKQLHLPITKEILANLQRVDSQYYHSFVNLIIEISEEKLYTKDMLKYLNPIGCWFEKFDEAKETGIIVSLIPPLLRLIFLLWKYNKYYHLEENIHRFLKIFTNKVIEKVYSVLGDYQNKDAKENLLNFKNALKICAKFRGTYLDTRDMVDQVNQKHEVENEDLIRNATKGDMWRTKVYGPYAFKSTYRLKSGVYPNETEDDLIDEICLISLWPARNSSCFDSLNRFIQRCNDCVELLQSSEHFRSLSDVARIGGASTRTLNSMVTEIDSRFQLSTKHFYQKVSNILDLKNSAIFERAFFEFRSVVKDLEKALGIIIDNSLDVCPTVESKLHLIEVFEGISGRDIVQKILSVKLQTIVAELKIEIEEIRHLVENKINFDNLLQIKNTPLLINRIITLRSYKERISKPLNQLLKMFPNALIGDSGWMLKRSIDEVLELCLNSEVEYIEQWNAGISPDIIECLRQPILILENSDMSADGPPQLIVNIDHSLVSILKEIKYLMNIDPNFKLSKHCRHILRSTDGINIDLFLRKLNLIVFQFNYAMRSMSIFERNLLIKDLEKIHELLQAGTNYYSWKMPESIDFIEKLMFLVSKELGRKLIIIQGNLDEIIEVGNSWSRGDLDIFSTCDLNKTNITWKLQESHKKIEAEIQSKLTWSQNHIEKITESTLNAIEINQDSPAWISYMEFLDSMILESIKSSVLMSLSSLQIHVNRDTPGLSPLLSVNLDLCANEIEFLIPLNPTINRQSISEIVMNWVNDYLSRAKCIKLINRNIDNSSELEITDFSFYQFIKDDEEIQLHISKIEEAVKRTVTISAYVLEIFNDYSFLWIPKIEESFKKFLSGSITPNPLRSSSRANYRSLEMLKTRGDSRTSSTVSKLNPAEEEQAERSFLTPKNMKEIQANNIPCLDDFNTEIDLYRTAIEELEALHDHKDIGCLRVILDPLRQVLIVYAQSWIWKYSEFLSEQVTYMLQTLEVFLTRVEPQVDSISGEERDTVSFMRLMRVFNEISAQQAITQNKFSTMNKAVDILQLYSPNLLKDEIIQLYQTIPDRWTNLKTKVSLAKQRLGPRIQEESETVSKDLIDFRQRVDKFEEELHNCEAYHYDCPLEGARVMLENFEKRVVILRNEASDLIELQNLLDNNIVNFETIKRCMQEISALKEVWETNRKIQNEQHDWKRHRWLRINPEFLLEATNKQLEIVEKLPEIIKSWDVWIRLKESVIDIQICIPLLTDLSSKTMRTRHWKQMVRATGGAIHVDSEVLKNMTFGELLSLGLQKHLMEVKMIVERANQDLKLENSLKTYEEVWLSKIFQFSCLKLQDITKDEDKRENNNMDNSNGESGSRIGGRSVIGSRNILSSSSKHRSRAVSTVSLPHSLTQLMETIDEAMDDNICLIHNTDEIFTQLDDHQDSLESMVNDNSAIGSFLDDVLKWKGQLRNIEYVLKIWLKVQQMWLQLYQIFLWQEFQGTLTVEVLRFKSIHKDFILLMMATKRNPNVLQCCNRKNMKAFLEDLYARLGECRQLILHYLSKRDHSFSKFYLLSENDLLQLVGSDISSFGYHVDKIWPNVDSLKTETIENDNNSTVKIVALHTKNEETIYLSNPILFSNSIESGLLNLESEIHSTLKYQLLSYLNQQKTLGNMVKFFETISKLDDDSKENNKEFFEEFFKTSCQIICIVVRIIITEEIDEILKTNNDSDFTNSIDDIYKKYTNSLQSLHDYSLQISSKILNLLNDDKIHFENIQLKIKSLINLLSEYCNFTRDFTTSNDSTFLDEWNRYPKFYFENNEGNIQVKIKMFNFFIDYGFDVTPLNDSSFGLSSINHYDLFNILSIKNQFSGGICYSDREEIVDKLLLNIASCVGKYFYNVDCSSTLDSKQVIRTLKYHFLADSWICLRNFDRLPHELKTIIQEIFSSKLNDTAENSEIFILGEKLNRNNSKGVLLLTLDRLIPQFSKKTDYLKIPVVFSSLTEIPPQLMEKFRLITVRLSPLSKQLELIFYRTGFRNSVGLSTTLSQFITHINTHFAVQIDNKDATNVNLASGFILAGLTNKMKLLLRTVDFGNELESFMFEKKVICKALMENYLNILTNEQHENFTQILTDFWKINSDETIISRSDSLSQLSWADVKQKNEYYITDQLQHHVDQIYNCLNYSKAIGVVGSSGCGKSTAINIALAIRRSQLKKDILTEKIYPNSYSGPLDNSNDNGVNRNVFQSVLMQFNMDYLKRTKENAIEYSLIVDGKFSMDIVESISNCLSGHNLVLNNGNRISLPPDLHIIFELQTMGDLHPGLVSHLSLIYCNQNKAEFIESGWRVNFHKLLKSSPIKELLSKCLDSTISSLLTFIDETTNPSVVNINYTNQYKHQKLQKIIKQSFSGALSTMVNYLSSMMLSTVQLKFDSESIRNIVAYSALWAFGGYISTETKVLLSDAIKRIFNLNLPTEYQQYSLYDLHLDIDKMKWYPWSELIATQVVTKNSGLAIERVVKTPNVEACNSNLTLLSDNGYPVLLIGESGCGKSSLIKERLKALCSGEVADILNVSIDINIYTRSSDISYRLNNNIQWQHGTVYTPVGNKKLIIFLDDLNSSAKGTDGGNAINEFTREILDSEGYWNYEDSKSDNETINYESSMLISISKKQLKNINIMATLNTEKVTNLDQRLLRHFNIIHVPNPSLEDQRSIFSVLVKGHLFGSTTVKSEPNTLHQTGNFNMPQFVDQLIKITIDLQERLNQQFKLISKPAHYYFNLYSLVQVFFNFCETITLETDFKTFLYSWRSECNWIFQGRMVDIVHLNKYAEAYESAVKGELAEKYKNVDLPMIAILDSNIPIFSSIKALDTGFVSTNSLKKTPKHLTTDKIVSQELTNHNTSENSNMKSNSSHKLKNYSPIADESRLEDVLQSVQNEYNKIYPPIHIQMHRTNMNIISRISRILTLDQNMGHCLLVADGSPGLSTTLLKLSAYIAGYQVAVSNSKLVNSHEYTIDSFKIELNNVFTVSGSKNEKVVMLIRDGDLLIPGVTQCIRDFIINVSVDDLFTIEQKTHIINAVRTEVVKSGLNYSRDVAWKFFIQNVIKNFRFAIIVNNCHSASFHAWMQHNSQLIGKLNLIWNRSWTKQELITNCQYIINNYPETNDNLSENEKENCCYLLYNIHTTTQEYDMARNYLNISNPVNKSGVNLMSCANNTTFERFTTKFCHFIERKLNNIENEEKAVIETLSVITEQEQLATRLFNQLNHEKQVLQDKIDAATSILNQIGENTLIVQSQMKTIHTQINEIKQLKKLVPEYKLAHDRFSYKAIAAFNQARDVVKNLDIDNLTELRSNHNPIVEVVELIETIIMILKSPSSDMTWNTGGKRLLANLERFTLDLLTFDERKITDETLSLLEPRLKKPSMQPDTIREKSEMPCCGDLCRWVHFVARYYKIMQNKVKPLHNKLEQTTKEVSEAEVRMKLLDEKRKNLNSRLQDLSNNFEQATLDRYNQEIKSSKVTEMLITSKNLIELLQKEKENALILKSSYKKRRSHIIGSCAIAAGFVTYLGQFEMSSRRELLTAQWPRCLQERGLSLSFDVVDDVQGLKILFEYPSLNQNTNRQEEIENVNEKQETQSNSTSGSKFQLQIPLLTDEQYPNFITAIASLVFNKRKDYYLEFEGISNFDLQQAILLAGNEDRLSVITDPSNYGLRFYTNHWNLFNQPFSRKKELDKEDSLQIIEMEQITTQIFASRIEEAIINGYQTVIHTDQLKLDSYVESLIQFCSSKSIKNQEFDARSIQIGNRRLFAEEGFRSILISNQCSSPHDNELYSVTNIINWKVTEDHIIDELTEKCFLHIGDNRTKIESRKKMNEKYRQQLNILMQELHLILVKSNQSTGKIWNNENIELLKLIIDDIKLVKEKINQYNQFLKQINQNKFNIKKQLMRMEVILQCLTNMGKINPNISFTPTIYLEIFEKVMTENNEFEYILPSNTNETNDNNIENGFVGHNSTTVLNGKTNEESILKWSTSDQIVNFETSDEDDKYLVEQLLNSIDSEEKRFLAQEITGIRSSKNQLKLKSFEFYMQRRGVIRPRPWKPQLKSKHHDNLSRLLQQDQMELPEKLKQIQNISNQIENIDKSDSDLDKTFKLLTEENIKDLVMMFESSVLYRLQLCLSHQEFLEYRFIYYLWLSEDPINAPSAMELEFFIHGSLKPEMKLTLSDFDCFINVPNWITSNTWDEILAVSILPGPLTELCVKVAENSEKWKSWYEIDEIENVDVTPLDDLSNSSDNDTSIKINTNKFTKLILLRIFRPDRCKIMMDKISLDFIMKNNKSIDFQSIIERFPNTKCILMSRNIVPSPDHLSVESFENEDPLIAIGQLAKNQSISASFVNCSTTSYDQLYSILENDTRKSDWIVVSFTDQNIIRTLKIIKQFLKNLISNTNPSPKLLWLVSKETDKIVKYLNSELLDTILILSEKNLKKIVISMKTQDVNINNFVIGEIFYYSLSAFHSQNDLMTKIIGKNSKLSGAIIWRLNLINSILMLRQLLGCRGVSTWKQIPVGLIKDQLLLLDSCNMETDFNSPSSIEQFVIKLIELALIKIYFDKTDIKMIKILCQIVFENVNSNDITINNLNITFPEYQSYFLTNFVSLTKETWFNDDIIKKLTCSEFESSMHINLSLTYKSISTIESFLSCLIQPRFNVKDLQSFDDQYISQNNKRIWFISKNKLKAKALFVSERLPSFIDLPILNLEPFQFNYYTSSSMTTKSSVEETRMTYHRIDVGSNKQLKTTQLIVSCIYDEIKLYNQEICKIQTQLHEIFGTNEEDLIDITEALINICCDIVEERVPHSWVSLTDSCYVATTHRLSTYIEYLSKRHQQLIELHQKIQKLSNNLLDKKFVILSPSLWLGGLKNSKVIFSGMKTNFVINENHKFENVKLMATFSETNKHLTDITITDSFIIGAYLEYESQKLLISQTKMINKITRIHLHAVDMEEIDQSVIYYYCPIYTNLSRSQFVDYILFPCENVESLALSGAFMVLDIGSDVKQITKEKIPVLVPPSITITESISPSVSLTRKIYEDKFTLLHTLPEEDENPETVGRYSTNEPKDQLQSDQKSDISIKKYSPIPPEMGLLREKQNLINNNAQNFDSNSNSISETDRNGEIITGSNRSSEDINSNSNNNEINDDSEIGSNRKDDEKINNNFSNLNNTENIEIKQSDTDRDVNQRNLEIIDKDIGGKELKSNQIFDSNTNESEKSDSDKFSNGNEKESKEDFVEKSMPSENIQDKSIVDDKLVESDDQMDIRQSKEILINNKSNGNIESENLENDNNRNKKNDIEIDENPRKLSNHEMNNEKEIVKPEKIDLSHDENSTKSNSKNVQSKEIQNDSNRSNSSNNSSKTLSNRTDHSKSSSSSSQN